MSEHKRDRAYQFCPTDLIVPAPGNGLTIDKKGWLKTCPPLAAHDDDDNDNVDEANFHDFNDDDYDETRVTLTMIKELLSIVEIENTQRQLILKPARVSTTKPEKSTL